MISEISGGDLVTMVTAAIALIGTVFTGIMAYFMAHVNRKASEAAVEVKDVKAALQTSTTKQEMHAAQQETGAIRREEKISAIAVVADKTHILVNSNMGVQLKLNAELSRWKAGQTGDPADLDAAILAEKLYAEHQGKQATVDAGPK